ncbi:MAG TPA: SdpI family protein [Anaerolineae bacterium]|nr:SdpI family protein [Anaerolineae bacterium]HQH39878.1 SdpI family protein [Anaerolineae bacterium]
MDNTAPGVPVGFMLLFVCTGLLLVGLSIPLLRRRIKPNGLYGFRTLKTLGDECIWYESNAYAGKWLLISGAIHTVVSLVLYFVPSYRANLLAYAITCGVIFALVFVATITLSFRFLHTL